MIRLFLQCIKNGKQKNIAIKTVMEKSGNIEAAGKWFKKKENTAFKTEVHHYTLLHNQSITSASTDRRTVNGNLGWTHLIGDLEHLPSPFIGCCARDHPRNPHPIADINFYWQMMVESWNLGLPITDQRSSRQVIA